MSSVLSHGLDPVVTQIANSRDGSANNDAVVDESSSFQETIPSKDSTYAYLNARDERYYNNTQILYEQAVPNELDRRMQHIFQNKKELAHRPPAIGCTALKSFRDALRFIINCEIDTTVDEFNME